MNQRKSVTNLSSTELADLRVAFNQMMSLKNTEGYSYLAGIYGFPGNRARIAERSRGVSDPNLRLFLPWNRAYILRFEQYLQYSQNDPAIALPWFPYSGLIRA